MIAGGERGIDATSIWRNLRSWYDEGSDQRLVEVNDTPHKGGHVSTT